MFHFVFIITPLRTITPFFYSCTYLYGLPFVCLRSVVGQERVEFKLLTHIHGHVQIFLLNIYLKIILYLKYYVSQLFLVKNFLTLQRFSASESVVCIYSCNINKVQLFKVELVNTIFRNIFCVNICSGCGITF